VKEDELAAVIANIKAKRCRRPPASIGARIMSSFQKIRILPTNSEMPVDDAQNRKIKLFRALVLDDSAVCLKQVGKIMADIGFATDLFFDGEQAFTHLSAHTDKLDYDVIITDLNMPLMEGVIFIYKVR